MKQLLFAILFIAGVLQYASGQENDSSGIRILFQGIVFDASSLKSIPAAQIFLNRSFSSISDEKGAFALYAFVRDTVVFKSLGYKPVTVIIGDSLAEKQFLAGIYMKTDTLEIGEVVIIPRLGNLKSEILNSKSKIPEQMENARYNVAVSAYQGRNSTGRLGDPTSNYELLRSQQKYDAYEKGQIPSDRIAGLSPFMLLPAAYMLMHGLPSGPAPIKPDVSDFELDQMMKRYLEKH